MRKIKFRVWHKKENRFLDPYAEEDPQLSLKDDGEGCEVYLYDRKTQEHTNKNCQMEDIVIQQFADCVDKEGTEIFEGDILHWDKGWLYPEMNGEVHWDHAFFFRNPTHHTEWCPGGDNIKIMPGWTLDQPVLESATVIGHIYKADVNE